jgi:ectoine hydroxylase-related dioxygenase (phytanoyl-CoA dioxygenase family)
LNQTPINKGQPFSKERTAEIIRDFRQNGFTLIPGVLEPHEVKTLREKTDALFVDPEVINGRYVQRNFILRHTNELDRIFCDLLIREPIYSLMEAIFGKGFQQCGMNVVRTDDTNAIDQWHVDDALFFPLPDDVPRHDPRIELPVQWLTVQVPLTDIPSIEHGPTQYVPVSHYSGRHPPKTETPTFEGRGPVSILCKAGDIYLHDPQCWHRGTPNKSGQVRYLLQQQYARRWPFPRYNAYVNYEMPEHIIEGASDRLLQVLGNYRFHPEDRYQ